METERISRDKRKRSAPGKKTRNERGIGKQGQRAGDSGERGEGRKLFELDNERENKQREKRASLFPAARASPHSHHSEMVGRTSGPEEAHFVRGRIAEMWLSRHNRGNGMGERERARDKEERDNAFTVVVIIASLLIRPVP